jgi:hypothetical protein
MKHLSRTLMMVLLVSPALALALAQPPKNKIGQEKAQAIALKAAPGAVESSELEHEHGQWVYSFDIRGADKMIHEVLVNAKSGKIVSNSIESKAEEAKEKAADLKEKALDSKEKGLESKK